ncbi:QueT transporter family protein [Facklamia miroungae]|uniref:Uncharacterized membrane protein n=1 Tax=Facklamia miroungae TaxID=120956 RepID=A0A1G7SVE5_9LACT|nr:QueT transporter family protein [Facklamia miroungae]NKZ29523.1 QueT transporter family protein [Facklamia miroungae]SDG26928.1 Uncharacterized membrane protein [Facklamia miroungae]
MNKNFTTNDLTRISLVAACYTVLTLILSPLSFGLGVRISEGLNFLAIYDKRYIIGVTLGVFISNRFSPFGGWDMIFGSLTSFIFLHLACFLIDKIIPLLPYDKFKRLNPLLVKYLIIGLMMTISMVNIALLAVFLGSPKESFIVLLLSMMMSEILSLILGGWIIYWVSKYINLTN